MARLIRVTDDGGGFGRDTELGAARDALGALDPASVAFYRWRLLTGYYSSRAMLWAIAERVAASRGA